MKKLLKSVQLGMISGEGLIEALENKDIFEGIQLAEDIREKVKQIFDEVIVEHAQKLVIFY